MRPSASSSRPSRWLVVLLVCCTTAPAFAQTTAEAPNRLRFLEWAYHDATAFVRGAAQPRAWLYTAGATAVLLPIAQLDDPIHPHAQTWRHGRLEGYLEWTDHLGGPHVKFATVTIAAASLLTDNPRFQDAAFTSLESLLAAGAVSYGLKVAFGRVRPKNNEGPFEFEPFSGHTSFPSGHATTAFAVLTPWILYYPNVATYSLFALSTGTAISRLARNKHWTTDVLTGSAIGFLMGYWLTMRHQRTEGPAAPGLPDRLAVTPAISPNGVHVSLTLSFGTAR